MQVSEDISLREYLHLLERRIKDPPCLDRYDKFLIKVWEFFALRAAAEDNYSRNLHLAYSKHGALPISWEQIRDTWRRSGPPEQIITRIAKKHFNDVSMLLGNMRKVLNRVRQKVALGRVQQVDSHCLRWLTRQPGLTPAEKGGARQEILGVVRVENYNTLENRVLKDFLQRCLGLATMYLRRYAEQFPQHTTIKAVAHYRNLCVMGLETETMKGVLDLHEMPQPNYVLQQDKLYSKVWNAYSTILRQEDVAERLWAQRKEVDDLYQHCVDGIELHCSPYARYRTPLWINELDGRQPIFEEPIWENELTSEEIVEPESSSGEERIINLTFPWDGREELIYPARHKNARPFLQNPHRPNLEPGETIGLCEILEKRDGLRLAEYFRQLHGLVGGRHWTVLVPDCWEPEWLETILRVCPQTLGGRENMFLLWRSVAAALGQMVRCKFADGETLVVLDGYAASSYNATSICFMREECSSRVIPQRASARLHCGNSPQCDSVRFHLDRPFSDHEAPFAIGDKGSTRIAIGKLLPDNFISPDQSVVYVQSDDILTLGVRRYLEERVREQISYYDELDGLSIVVTNAAEEVCAHSIVEPNNRSPGGIRVSKWLENECWMYPDSCVLNLCLYEGIPKRTDKLKKYVATFNEKTSKKTPISFHADMIPGQGLARVVVTADFLDRPVELDLRTMLQSGLTMAIIEDRLERHFPPVMPLVEASRELWSMVIPTIQDWLKKNAQLPNTVFTLGRDKYANRPLPLGSSPIERLRRENVFGNDPRKRYPVRDKDDWFRKFVSVLVSVYRHGGTVGPLAWTYQFDNADIEFIRNEFTHRYVKMHEVLRPEEISFCCNNFAEGDARITLLLSEALTRIGQRCNQENDLRLVYNLLQFHYSAASGLSSELCEKGMSAMIAQYNQSGFRKYVDGNRTTLAGYLLKSMLFLLHRRRYDDSFFACSSNWIPSGDLNEPLLANTPARARNETTRRLFIDYVRGRGSLSGFPTC